jgi:hypothetical protein
VRKKLKQLEDPNTAAFLSASQSKMRRVYNPEAASQTVNISSEEAKRKWERLIGPNGQIQIPKPQ